ncbi:MAG TPA: hypothetical protein VL860_04175, partial [Planctomycetota bacterium]|nr:hypothetical protein [Planctomycetota bacterium]
MLIVSGCGDKPIVDTGEQTTIEGTGLELPKAYADQIRKKYPHAEIQYYFERRKPSGGVAFCTLYKDSTNLKDPK